MSDVEVSVRGGAVLRGEVYARWREIVASGELRLRPSRATTGHVAVEVAGSSDPSRPRACRRRSRPALAALVTEADVQAAAAVPARWRAEPAGAGTARRRPDARPRLGRASATRPTTWCTAGRPRCAQRQARRGCASPASRDRTARHDRRGGTARRRHHGYAAPSAAAAAVPPCATRTPQALGERARAELLFRVGELLAPRWTGTLIPVVAGVGVDPVSPSGCAAAAAGCCRPAAP